MKAAHAVVHRAREHPNSFDQRFKFPRAFGIFAADLLWCTARAAAAFGLRYAVVPPAKCSAALKWDPTFATAFYVHSRAFPNRLAIEPNALNGSWRRVGEPDRHSPPAFEAVLLSKSLCRARKRGSGLPQTVAGGNAGEVL
jgi:hypothetical protein